MPLKMKVGTQMTMMGKSIRQIWVNSVQENVSYRPSSPVINLNTEILQILSIIIRDSKWRAYEMRIVLSEGQFSHFAVYRSSNNDRPYLYSLTLIYIVL